jgi:hypothetical protein
MSRGSAGPSGNFSARAPAGNAPGFSASNGGGRMSAEGFDRGGRGFDRDRMGRDRGDRDHDRGRFRSFAFGFPGYYSDYDYDYNDYSCFQVRQVPTRYGWRWRRVWVCD